MSLNGSEGVDTARRKLVFWWGIAVALALVGKTADVVEQVRTSIERAQTDPHVFTPPMDRPVALPERGIPEVSVWENEVRTVSLRGLPQQHPLLRASHLHTWGGMLGRNQMDEVLRIYNPAIDGGKRWPGNKKKHVMEDFSFPLVFPSLLEVFPSTIEQFAKKYPNFGATVAGRQTMVIAKKTPQGKSAVAVYVEGRLALATHISPGRKSAPKRNARTRKKEPGWEETPDGLYMITEKLVYRQSQAFEAPMPYAMNFVGGKFFHAWDANGDKLSHGCVRLPLAYMQVFHELVPQGAPVIIALESVPKPSNDSILASQ